MRCGRHSIPIGSPTRGRCCPVRRRAVTSRPCPPELGSDCSMDLAEFAEEVGNDDPVSIAGLSTRGGPVEGVRVVMAPTGIDWVRPEEMTVQCGAGVPVEELDDALAEHGQAVAIPPTGTLGGALAVGRSGI